MIAASAHRHLPSASAASQRHDSGPLVSTLLFHRRCPIHKRLLSDLECPGARLLGRGAHHAGVWEVVDSAGHVHYTATEEGIVAIGILPKGLPAVPSPLPLDPSDAPLLRRGPRSWSVRTKNLRRLVNRRERGVLPSHRLVGKLDQILRQHLLRFW